MLLITLLSAFFMSSAESYSILRLEPQRNLAVIATVEAEKYKAGSEFVVETPQGACYLVVDKIVTDYIYVKTEQCQREYLAKGTPIAPRSKVIVERTITTEEPTVINAEMSTDSVSADLNFINQEFYEKYVKNRLSATFSYLTGSSLDGTAQLNQTTTISDFHGSNTLSFGAEYFFWKLPYNLSLSAGAAYQLPRSYGRFQLQSNGAGQVANFGDAAKIETLSLFSNLRYQWNEKTYAYFGLNHLFVNSTGFAGDMNGDFGFHLGGRYYVLERLFADASLNFYNLDYEVNNQKFDFSMSELELKAGYTF